MKKSIVFGLLFLLTMSCKEKQEASFTLSEEKMIDVLVDIHLAEAATYNALGSVKDSLLKVYYAQVYQIHEVNKEEIDENLDILMNNPRLADAIYKKVTDKLSEKEK